MKCGSSSSIANIGRFLGVVAAEPRESDIVHEAQREKSQGHYRTNGRTGPTMEELLEDAREFVPTVAWSTFERKVKARYQ